MNKLPYTPNSTIKNALRKVWMRSRERASALKRTEYCCSNCGVKQSKAKGHEVSLHVHHEDGIDWDGIIEMIRNRLLPNPQRLTPLCMDCHKQEEDKITRAQEDCHIKQMHVASKG